MRRVIELFLLAGIAGATCAHAQIPGPVPAPAPAPAIIMYLVTGVQILQVATFLTKGECDTAMNNSASRSLAGGDGCTFTSRLCCYQAVMMQPFNTAIARHDTGDRLILELKQGALHVTKGTVEPPSRTSLHLFT